MRETIVEVNNALIHSTGSGGEHARLTCPRPVLFRLTLPPAAAIAWIVLAAATAAVASEHSMTFFRPTAGRRIFVRALAAAGLGLVMAASAVASGPFPFDHDLLLDAAPIRPLKRVLVLNVASDSSATTFLWCQTVRGRVELVPGSIRIEPGTLPQGLPRYMVDGQGTPERVDADLATLTALSRVTGCQRQGQAVVLTGPMNLVFRPSNH